MKNILTGFLLLCSTFVAAQANYGHKLNLSLANLIADEQSQFKEVNLLVQGSLSEIRELTELHSGIYRYAVGNIATVRIPVSAIPAFAASQQISRIESPFNHYATMNDSMRSSVRVNDVQNGLAPLPQGFNGTGIAIGIIDTGVDLTHPDLQDSSGNTRVKYLWDQRKPLAANTPAAYGYGQEWDNTAIDAGLAISDDVQGFGHGTHVTGIAAGDGSAINKNKGIAPEADIIEVAFDFNNLTSPTYIDAVDYIFNKAQVLGKPCVINASLGDYYGSHDGLDLQSQMINTLLNQQSGRAMVAAAGNAGNIPFHLGYNVTNDTSFTWIRHNPAFPYTYLQLWGDTSDFDGIDFSLGADVNTTSASFRGNLVFRDIFYNLGIPKSDTLFSTSGNRLAVVQSYGSLQGSAYLLEFIIIPDSNTYSWRLMTTGSGRFALCKFYDGTGQPGYVNSALPAAAVVPEIVYYKLPYLNSTIVSGFQCLDNVITVGNYGNRNTYIDVNGTPYTDPNVTPGQIAANSSHGPTRDGRIKPDISAPGGIMLSCGQLSLMAIWLTQPTNAVKIAQGGFHIRDGGTSSSSPVIAGIAALYLQQNPTASAMQVRNAIINCAVQDVFTGTALPNNTWGYGKTDAFNTLVNCSMTGISEINNENEILLFPNPVHAGESVSIKLGQTNTNQLRKIIISDIPGKMIAEKDVPLSGEISVPTRNFKSGIYFISILEKGIITKTAKISVIE